VWRHGKGTTRSACAGTDDSSVLCVRICDHNIITMAFHNGQFVLVPLVPLSAGKIVHQPRVPAGQSVERDDVVRTLSLTTTCPAFSIGSFPSYSSLSLPHDLSPRTLMNLYRVPEYCCPKTHHTFAEIQTAPLSITLPATLPRVLIKSYGSSKIPTTRQTFSSEPCLTVVCVQPDSTGVP
jgi:hypothetical protein